MLECFSVKQCFYCAFLTNPRMSAIYPSLNLQTPDQMADQSRARQTKVVIKTKC